MRISPILLALLPITMLACSEPAPAKSPTESKNEQDITTLEQRFAPGDYAGTTASGEACNMHVTHARSSEVREFELVVTLDAETRPAGERQLGARFSLSTLSKATSSFTDTVIDVDVDAGSGVDDHYSHLKAAKTGDSFAYADVEELVDGINTQRRCEKLVKAP